MPDFQQTVGVVGAGTFGTAIANLLSRRVDVLLYSRNPDTVERINRERQNFGINLSPRISAIGNVQELAEKCTLIFPVVPSDGFRSTMTRLGPHLRPYHILIHGTKGFDVQGITPAQMDEGLLEPQHVSTMSQVITQETVVRRVGCLSGPNLATEILEGQPTATVIGSVYEEVIELGKKVLSSDAFHVFGNNDILGAELAGALKNIIAIGSGILRGR
nr:NAD(P)-binding domain-containing protein [Haliscomenobacter sp.]